MNRYYRLVRIFVRSMGFIWMLVGIYGLVAVVRLRDDERYDRLTILLISIPALAVGYWFFRARNPRRLPGNAHEGHELDGGSHSRKHPPP